MGNVEVFKNQDSAYLRWVGDNPDGFVLNTNRSFSPSLSRVHGAWCPTIQGSPANGNTWTSGDYVKACASELEALLDWGSRKVGQEPPGCGRCRP